ncbi:MAG TPA: molybdopterin-dependent oxidoreductase [Bacteroidota bacterium]|jgi:NADH-quinone oxidoreductase subunit G
MPKITIDGKQLEVEATSTIIQAAFQNGITIPHFCWHPRLSVAGNCRMCLVEVEKLPKLVIACSTQVAEGMVVKTNSDRVVNAQQAVMEFLLINHPLDCPICDEAGECKLQDYAYNYSVGQSRFEFNKVRKPKRVELGPNVMLDTERCIMCSRCVRFCSEVAKSPQLVFTQRADHVELTTFPDEKLDNPYSMNTIDICPVGALTSKDFRFKARVWEMSATDTVCQGCARGCNVKMWVRNNQILRLTPRFNPDVNDYWMCDFGRLETFKSVDAGTRINQPMIRKDDKLVPVGWDEAISRTALELKAFKRSEIAGVPSPYATNEDNFALMKLMDSLGAKRMGVLKHVIEGSGDEILLREDKTPNGYGATEIGLSSGTTALDLESVLEGINAGSIKALYVIDEDLAADPDVAEVLSKLDLLIVHASSVNETTKIADIVLSSSTYAEKHGTIVNFQGHVQRLRPAVATAEMDRALDGFSMSRLDKFGAPNDRWTKSLKREARPTWRILTNVAGALNSRWKFNTAEDVFNEIASTVGAFKGMTYAKIGSRGMKLRKSSLMANAVRT